MDYLWGGGTLNGAGPPTNGTWPGVTSSWCFTSPLPDACGVMLFAATNPTAMTTAKTASNVLMCILKV